MTASRTATVDVYCVSCGEDGEADAQTGRCLRCGKPAIQQTTQATLDRNAHLTHSSPSAAYRSPVEPFPLAARAPNPPGAALPEQGAGSMTAIVPPPSPQPECIPAAAPASAPGRPPREWIDATRALGEGLLTAAADEDRQADDARATAAAHHTQAIGLRKRAAIFTQLLMAADVEFTFEPVAAPTAPASPPGTRWSKNSAVQVDACIDCGRADIPHIANGRCRPCDGRWRAARKGAP